MDIVFDKISWDHAITKIEEIYQLERKGKWRRWHGELCSLSALFAHNFSNAVHRINNAIEIDPLNPLHHSNSERKNINIEVK